VPGEEIGVFQPQKRGLLPVVILSHDVFNKHSGTVVAAAITSREQRFGFPLTLRIHRVKLPKPSWVRISRIRTPAVERLGKKMGRLLPEKLDQSIEGFFMEIVGD